jgi:hypothetical protein
LKTSPADLRSPCAIAKELGKKIRVCSVPIVVDTQF